MTTTKVNSEFIAVNAISGTIIADGAITSTHLAANCVDSSELVTGSIDTIHIAANQVTATKVVTNAIQTRHIADDQVTEAKLANAINTSIAAKLPLAGGTMTGNIAHAGDFTLDVGGDLFLDADGAGIYLSDGGTSVGRFLLSSSDLTIGNLVQDKDIKFAGNDGGSGVTALTLDMSDAGKAVFNAGATFANRVEINYNGDYQFKIDNNVTEPWYQRVQSDGTFALHLNGTGNIFHATSSGIGVTGDIDVTSTDAGSSAGPIINLVRDSSSPADADYIGQIKFKGEDDGGASTTYSKITGKIGDASNGSEDGIIEFAAQKAGSSTILARLSSTKLALLNSTELEAPVVDGENFKINGAQGSDGQVLTSTGSGVAWESVSGGVAGISTSADATAITIDSSERIGMPAIGQTHPVGGQAKLGINADNAAGASLSIHRHYAGAFGGYLVFQKSRNTNITNLGVVSDDDILGSVEFTGADGNSYAQGAHIRALVDGTPGDADMPTRLTFSTSADGSGTPTERLRITSAGNVGIATTSPAQTFEVAGDIRIMDARSLMLKRATDNFAWRLRNESSGDESTYGFDGYNDLVFEVIQNSNVSAVPSATSHTLWNASANTLVLKETGHVGVGLVPGTARGKFTVEQTSTGLATSEFLNKSGSLTGYASTMTDGSYTSNTANYSFLTCFTGNGSAISDVEFSHRGDGQAYADGAWNGGGADYAEYFEWADGNSGSEDRRGWSVVLVNEKIRRATSDDAASTIIGVISGNPGVVGDSDIQGKWKGKYLIDDFGTPIRENVQAYHWETIGANGKPINHDMHADRVPDGVTVPTVEENDTFTSTTVDRKKDNPAYVEGQAYVQRENRKEWDTVGLMGKLRILKTEQKGTNWIKMRDISATVEEWLVR